MDGCIGAYGGGVVVPFPRRARPAPSLNVSERIQALRWADEARSFGVREVCIHEPEPGDDPAVGGFMLIYEDDDIWAAWGIAVRADRFEVWRPSNGTTMGLYPSLQEALRAIRPIREVA